MLSLNLLPVLRARGVERPFTFLVKAGFPPYTAHNLLSSKTVTFQLRNIEKLCMVLNCTPDELLVWTPNKNQLITDTHPLTKLRNKNPDYNWQDTIKTIPLDQLRELVSIIKGKDKPTDT
ncbi:MAG: Cro/C1-type DNA-binding domain [Bacteroidetes bacterium]|jgi:hypothetical protein|nr:Cro/C1-type DNA-binding domain [Bacteroidota bacterium]